MLKLEPSNPRGRNFVSRQCQGIFFSHIAQESTQLLTLVRM